MDVKRKDSQTGELGSAISKDNTLSSLSSAFIGGRELTVVETEVGRAALKGREL